MKEVLIRLARAMILGLALVACFAVIGVVAYLISLLQTEWKQLVALGCLVFVVATIVFYGADL